MALPAQSEAPATGNSHWRFLPNAITLLRIVLVAPLFWTIWRHRFGPALILVAVAGLSDALDGFLAKRYGWQSWLGGVLDPIADKLMLIACFVSLCLAGVLPLWLMWLVVGRDLVIAIGASAYHFLIGRVIPQPSLLSKITTFIQIVCVLALLINLSAVFKLPPALLDALFWTTAAATLASGAHYVGVWSRKAVRSRRERSPA